MSPSALFFAQILLLPFTCLPVADGKHTVFGELSDGEDVLQQLEKLGSPSGTPTEPLNIESSKIRVEL